MQVLEKLHICLWTTKIKRVWEGFCGPCHRGNLERAGPVGGSTVRDGDDDGPKVMDWVSSRGGGGAWGI